ncbi:hypothetical protein Pla175_33890 [Pirellulimonas nuda]|uniref:DUF5060 domain-containing protein n=1 Tax=Pirellulimonas nuda TaxID=2528009 RepID=A0A518DEU0_9BACT|nr:DUF5060 domain-containing protein [Pirellulimonas nuda]QDU89990.1 hypothetical protein Pla175_33890 [Pirellulimonas nuda]
MRAFRFGALAVLLLAGRCWAADATAPIAEGVVFEERYGVLAIEAEHFASQSKTDTRAWHRTTTEDSADAHASAGRDVDPSHAAGASGGAYLEILPDTRANHDEKLIPGENFSPTPGEHAVLTYKTYFNTPGRYYVWARAYSTGPEDNGIHFGLDGQWPATGQRWQTVAKNKWHWESKQRTEEEHTGVPFLLYLDIEQPGEHELMVSMREDGFELDKIVLTTQREEARPDGVGPDPVVRAGKAPAAYPFRKPQQSAVAAQKAFPAHWGEPPAVQTRDLQPLPGGYGQGSGTLAEWIQENLDNDRAAVTLTIEANEFPTQGAGYYLDRGQWMAINPETNKEATAETAFAFPNGLYDVTLQAVGESDGQSTYLVLVNDEPIGDFRCPLSQETFEEAPKYAVTWKNVPVNSGDVVKVSSAIASADGKEYSRARWARLVFKPANEATVAAVAAIAPKKAEAAAPAKRVNKGPRGERGDGSVSVSGEPKQWHKVTLTLDGPFANEADSAPNPHTDIRFDAVFTHESGGPSYRVPGYFAADGDAGNTSAQAGTKWRVHFAPDKVGKWNYQLEMARGPGAALDGGGKAMPRFDGKKGQIEIAASDKSGRDFRGQGRLNYVGGPYLKFAGSGKPFVKAGADAPETLLAYTDFDDTTAHKGSVPLKTWKAHEQDYRTGDPSWKDGKGKGLIGALNYLASKGLNAFSFLPYNAGGDGDNVWPFASREDKLHYDCSKLDQWGVVFDHGTAQGLFLHFKLQENEMDDDRRGHDADSSGAGVAESLDGGKLGPERKLYCRQMIARFGHNLALNWNIGEENTQSTQEIKDMASYLDKTDPYKHPVVIHTFPNQQDKVYKPLLGDASKLAGASLQNSWNDVHHLTKKWVDASREAGKPWVVANDEQGPASDGVPSDPGYEGKDGVVRQGKSSYNLDDIRKHTLWGNLMAGGAGVEYYFGYKQPQNDLVCEDYRSRDKSWDYCRIALEFFGRDDIPLTEMTCLDELVGNPKHDNSRYCFAKPGELYLVYLPKSEQAKLDLSGQSGEFSVRWFNPRTGGELVQGAVDSVKGGGEVSLGQPPKQSSEDWLAVVRKK